MSHKNPSATYNVKNIQYLTVLHINQIYYQDLSWNEGKIDATFPKQSSWTRHGKIIFEGESAVMNRKRILF